MSQHAVQNVEGHWAISGSKQTEAWVSKHERGSQAVLAAVHPLQAAVSAAASCLQYRSKPSGQLRLPPSQPAPALPAAAGRLLMRRCCRRQSGARARRLLLCNARWRPPAGARTQCGSLRDGGVSEGMHAGLEMRRQQAPTAPARCSAALASPNLLHFPQAAIPPKVQAPTWPTP